MWQGIPFYISFVAIITALLGVGFVKLPYWTYEPILNIAKIILPVLLIFALFWTIRQGIKQKSRTLIFSVISLVVVAIANSLFWLVIVLNFFLSGDYVYHGDIEFNGNRYYVDSSWKPGVGLTYPSSFYLHKCDNSGTNCEIIHEQEYRKIPKSDYEAMIVRLIPDSVTNTVALEINGEIVYTHHPGNSDSE